MRPNCGYAQGKRWQKLKESKIYLLNYGKNTGHFSRCQQKKILYGSDAHLKDQDQGQGDQMKQKNNRNKDPDGWKESPDSTPLTVNLDPDGMKQDQNGTAIFGIITGICLAP